MIKTVTWFFKGSFLIKDQNKCQVCCCFALRAEKISFHPTWALEHKVSLLNVTWAHFFLPVQLHFLGDLGGDFYMTVLVGKGDYMS